MKWTRLLWVCLAAFSATVWGCARVASTEPQVARLTVNESGFSPLEVHARAGQLLTLLVTRQSESSCAKQILIADAGINRALPLRQEVNISFTPERRGKMQYTCCDDMVGGTIVVR